MRTPTAASTIFLTAILAGSAPAQRTVRVSDNDQGVQPGGVSSSPSVSHDGRHVAFATSGGLDTVQPDTNGTHDVYVRDRVTSSTVRVSLSSAGAEGDGGSWFPSLSADGRHVAFDSNATTLAPGANGVRQVYVHDRDADADGVFDEPGARTTVLISLGTSGVAGTGRSRGPSISGDGRYVAFTSLASDLVAGDVNGHEDVFVHDRDADGNGIFDETTPGSTLTRRAVGSFEPNGRSLNPTVAASAPIVVFETEASTFAGDSTLERDIVAWDFLAPPGSAFSVVSRSAGGVQANADCFDADVSADGRWVVFHSMAGNLAPGGLPFVTDVFLRDRDVDGNGVFDEPAGTATTLVTVTPAGGGSAGLPDAARVSDDGRFVAFFSLGADLVPNDTNGQADIFVWARETGQVVRASVDSQGAQATGSSSAHAISGDGLHVAFYSLASNLVLPDANGNGGDAFVRECPFPDLARVLYCAGKPNSAGCVPFLVVDGCASTTATAPMSITAHDVAPAEAGFLLYGFKKANINFHGGRLCVKLPFARTPLKAPQNPGGGCSGWILRRDFNKTVQSGVDPSLTVGQTVFAQWRQRDPADPLGFGDGFSDAVRFVVGP